MNDQRIVRRIAVLNFLTILVFSDTLVKAETETEIELSLGLGGRGVQTQIGDRTTNFSGGYGQWVIGRRNSDGSHFDFLIQGGSLDPYPDSDGSKSLRKEGYELSFADIGIRYGKRWSRFHLWGDLTVGRLFESYSTQSEPELSRHPSTNTYGYTGIGAGYEIIKFEGLSLELFGELGDIYRLSHENLSQSMSHHLMSPSYGLFINFNFPPCCCEKSQTSSSFWRRFLLLTILNI